MRLIRRIMRMFSAKPGDSNTQSPQATDWRQSLDPIRYHGDLKDIYLA